MATAAATSTKLPISFNELGPPRCLLTGGPAIPSEELGAAQRTQNCRKGEQTNE